jgi:hypothetical protein
MNDFTKEELDELRSSRCYHLDNNYPYGDALFMKLESLIENYCEHNNASFRGDVYGYECKDCKCNLHEDEIDDHEATL